MDAILEVPEADGWEHVSVHAWRGRQSRTPAWKEMIYVKALCGDDEDVVVQYHPKKSEYVYLHKNVLHLWRSRLQPFPTPPPILVGPLRCHGDCTHPESVVAGGCRL